VSSPYGSTAAAVVVDKLDGLIGRVVAPLTVAAGDRSVRARSTGEMDVRAVELHPADISYSHDLVYTDLFVILVGSFISLFMFVFPSTTYRARRGFMDFAARQLSSVYRSELHREMLMQC